MSAHRDGMAVKEIIHTIWTDGPAKTVQRNGEKHRTDRGQCEELRPHHVDTRPPVQDGLAGGDEVRGWRGQHHLLHQLGHACARG